LFGFERRVLFVGLNRKVPPHPFILGLCHIYFLIRLFFLEYETIAKHQKQKDPAMTNFILSTKEEIILYQYRKADVNFVAVFRHVRKIEKSDY
jgi:hypothetical protein